MNTVPPRDAQGNPLTAYIYALLDPETNAIRYIGKTTSCLRDRLNAHTSEIKDDRKNRWIKKLKRQGLKPTIQLVEEVLISTWRERECYWIAFYRAQGCDLTNVALGGQGGENHSPETKAKITKSLTGRKLSPEAIEKRSATVRGRKRPPEVGEKVRAAKLGKKRKPFTRSDKGKRRNPLSLEVKAKMSLAKKEWHAMRKRPPSDTPTLWD